MGKNYINLYNFKCYLLKKLIFKYNITITNNNNKNLMDSNEKEYKHKVSSRKTMIFYINWYSKTEHEQYVIKYGKKYATMFDEYLKFREEEFKIFEACVKQINKNKNIDSILYSYEIGRLMMIRNKKINNCNATYINNLQILKEQYEQPICIIENSDDGNVTSDSSEGMEFCGNDYNIKHNIVNTKKTTKRVFDKYEYNKKLKFYEAEYIRILAEKDELTKCVEDQFTIDINNIDKSLNTNEYIKVKEKLRKEYFDKIEIINKSFNKKNTVRILVDKEKGIYTKICMNDYKEYGNRLWHDNQDGYAADGHKMLMHRLITNCPEELVVNHINHNPLDNRRWNLENITNKVNASLKNKSLTTKNKYLHVSQSKKSDQQIKYMVRIKCNYIQDFLGEYDTEEEAANVIDMHIVHIEQYKKYTLNFPEKRKNYEQTPFIPYIKKNMIQNKYFGVTNVENSNIKIGKVLHDDINVIVYEGNSEYDCAMACDIYIVNNNISNRMLNFPESFPNYIPSNPIKTKCDFLGNGTVRLHINGCNYGTIFKKKYSYALIDEEDYDKIKYNPCYYNEDGYITIRVLQNYSGYIIVKQLLLHRYIMNAKDGKQIDHQFGNTTDNRKSMLLETNAMGNAQNKNKRSIYFSSQYFGVSRNKTMWRSNITYNKKRISLGTFDNEEAAARKRDLYIILELTNVNFSFNFDWNLDDALFWNKKFGMVSKNDVYNIMAKF